MNTMLVYLKLLFAKKHSVDCRRCGFKHTVPLTHRTATNESPQQPKKEVAEWLKTFPTGKFKYNVHGSEVESVSFELEDDAVHYRLTWL